MSIWRRLKYKFLKKAYPDVSPLEKIGYEKYVVNYVTVKASTELDRRSYEYLATADGIAKYDAKYGLTRQLADELKKYVDFTTYYDEARDRWILTVSVKVVKP